METLETLQQRIATTESLASLVGSMKALSSVSIRHYERAVSSSRDYERTVALGFRVVLPALGPFFADSGRRGARTGLVVFGSDYGLCGQFNDEIASFAAERADRLGVAPHDRLLIAVGERAAVRLRDRGLEPETELRPPNSVAGLEAAVRRLLLLVDAWRAERVVGRVLLAYHQHRTPTERRLHAQQLLPFPLARFRRLAAERWPSRRLPSFTMDPDRLFAALVRQYLFVACFRAFAESAASEHASRVETMQAAERNIDEKLDEVHAEFRRRRQDAITAELLDIVSGYEALSAGRGRAP